MVLRKNYAAVGLVSSSLLILQTSFTRLIGYKLFYHFVFLAIALSLLGLGAAGTYVAVRRPCADIDRVLRRWLMVLSVLIPISFLAIANPPIATQSELVVKLLGGDALKYLAWCSIFMVALNFAGGVVLTQIFRSHSDNMGRLYAVDLLSAGAGCLVSVGLMKYLSPPTAFLATVFLVCVALVPFLMGGPTPARERRLGVFTAVLAVAVTVGVAIGPQRFRSFENFRRTGGAPQPTVLRYEWNHIIRTDVLADYYLLDGEASTEIVRWTPQQQALPVVDPGYAVAVPRPRVGIIGFGGGPQVSEARRAGAAHIMAVDINPSIARWVLGEDRQQNRGLFADPSIDVVNDEGRHAVRSRGEKLDVLVMHAIDTYSATAAGAYALSENFLYTKEAIEDYLTALVPGGVMSIQRWLFNPPRENLRLFATALEAFEELGYQEPTRHIAMLAPIDDFERVRTEKLRIWGYLLFSPTPFSDAQLTKLRAFVADKGWTCLYTPGGHEKSPFADYALSKDRTAFRASYPYVIKPVTDASPYLFQFYNPLSSNARHMSSDWVTSGIYQSSAVTLLGTFLVSIVASLVLILLPLWFADRRDGRDSQRAARLGMRDVVFLCCLGVGFMALEVPLTQILALYLGHPIFGFSVVLVALLVSSGFGSLLSQRFTTSQARVCTLVAALLMALSVGIFPFVHSTIQSSSAVRFTAAVLMVVLCGLPMGFPLALAIREIGRVNPRNVAWAWGINGAASVVGSCAVMLVMVFLETRWSLVVGASSYALAAAVSVRRRSRAAETRGVGLATG